MSWVSRRACSNNADDEEAVVLAYTSLVFRALNLHQFQEQFLEKNEVDMSTPVHAVAMSLNTCRASHNFSCAKMHGLDSVSWRVVTWRKGYCRVLSVRYVDSACHWHWDIDIYMYSSSSLHWLGGAFREMNMQNVAYSLQERECELSTFRSVTTMTML